VPAELSTITRITGRERLAQARWNGIHYKLVGAAALKEGKFYFVDQEHSRAIAERFSALPQAAIVYFGSLSRPAGDDGGIRGTCARRPDRKLGTNDCRGWMGDRCSSASKKSMTAKSSRSDERLRRERVGKVSGRRPGRPSNNQLFLRTRKRKLPETSCGRALLSVPHGLRPDTQAKAHSKAWS